MTTSQDNVLVPRSRHPLDTTGDLYRMLLLLNLSPSTSEDRPIKFLGILRDISDPYNRTEVCVTVPPAQIDFRFDRVVMKGLVCEHKNQGLYGNEYECEVTVYIKHSNDAWVDIISKD